MTASQYKNIVEWTYRLHPELVDMDEWSAIRKVFDCLGVAFPQGYPEEILSILQNNAYMGWTPCSREDACEFANMGIPAIQMDEKNIVLIIPCVEINSLTALRDEVIPVIDSIRSANEIASEEGKNMHFFAYSYRQGLKKEE